eukprot:Blabericola_migrator_1__5642@NODE_2866_length_2265_cov_36_198817_g1096_i3_p2_GENE_NODE_2866_length_2265_cov_36_198817_g1096_i3NODE_2866_length_2265_cov_36_198817_g1096_i3_p2_ORF_typecomplete_len122_score13_55_NODE_2866_length_2265_cov_36_198817_g1096_i317142079
MFNQLRSIYYSFKKVCATSDVSHLAEDIWALCVSETRKLWRTYGQAYKNLLLTACELRECSTALANLIVEDRPLLPSKRETTELLTGPRHPWDTLLIKVMLYLISQMDRSTDGVTDLLTYK